jgi:DNA-binding transcriptional LysR family regulator
MDRIDAMRVFAKVVDEGTLSAAARRLAVSKSSVSKQLARLEDRVGARLLHRSTRKLAPTEAGRAFYDRCVRIVRDVEEAELEAGHAHAAPHGLLKVNMPPSFGRMYIAPLLPEFVAKHPKIRLDLALSDDTLDTIAGGFDVTIRPALELEDSTLIARRLAPCRCVVCGSPEYFARRGIPTEPAQLEKHNCLIYSYPATRRAWHFSGENGRSWIRVSGSIRANTGDVLREAVLAGVGIAQLPTFIVGPDLAAGALVAVLASYEDSSAAVWALQPPGRRPSPKVRAFVDFLAARLGPNPPWDSAPSGAARPSRNGRTRGTR